MPGGLVRACENLALALFICPSDNGSHDTRGATNYTGNRGYGFDANGTFDNGAIADSVKTAFGPAAVSDGLSTTVAMAEWLISRGGTNGRPPARLIYCTPPHLEGSSVYQGFLSNCESLSSPESGILNTKGDHWLAGSPGFSTYSHDNLPNGKTCVNGGYLSMSAFTSSSNHEHSVQAVFIDGHVASIRDTVSLPIWRALSTRNGGETNTNLP